MGVMHQSFSKKPNTFFNCQTSSSPCDTYCFWGSTCVYSSVSIGKKDPCYKVYRQVSSIWEVVVKIATNNVTKIATMNVNNPSVLMQFTTLRTTDMPIYITNYQSEIIHTPEYVINVDNVMYPVTASSLNFPMKGEVGEFQLSTKRTTETVDPDIMKCQVDNCEVVCERRESAVDRFKAMVTSGKISKVDRHLSLNNGETTDVIIPVKPVLTMTVGNVNFKNLLVSDIRM